MIVDEVRRIVEEACKDKSNKFEYGTFDSHIVAVVKYSKLLAKRLGADEEIAELAAWLHDFASVSDVSFIEEHHMHGARLAEELLTKLGYPEDRIQKVKHCIFAHRASKNIPRESIEADIVASADSMAHFDNLNALFYVAFKIHCLDIFKGTQWVLGKLERSWKKMMPEAKEIMKEKYDAVKELFLVNSHPDHED